MTADGERDNGDSFLEALGDVGSSLLTGLHALEVAQRRLHPPDFGPIRDSLVPVRDRLEAAVAAFQEVSPPPGLQPLAQALAAAVAPAVLALRGFSEEPSAAEGVTRILAAMHQHCLAQDALFTIRRALPPVNHFFLESHCRDRLDTLDPEAPAPEARAGLHTAHDAPGSRGGFSFYVPESYDGTRAWPLVVALHGGSGQGRDFKWTWLREARSRQFLLLAPTARGATWSFNGPDVDAVALRSMLAFVRERWKVDPNRVLLSGLSDGATYSLVAGLQADMPFTALAPVSGVLHPANFANGNMDRVRGKRIYLVHGALDWMFPVDIARMARDELLEAGADLVYREIADLSHTYPREENPSILEWFDPGLAVPQP